MTGAPASGYYAQYARTAAPASPGGILPLHHALNFGVYDKNNVLPYTINYTLNVQWQPASTLAISVGFTGNGGRHSVIPIPINEPGIATPTNPIWGETSSYVWRS